MNTVSWKLDPHGIVGGLGLHDGYFYGIIVDRDDIVKLTVRSYTKEYYTILLENVGSMNVMHFWGGDIILDVSLLPIGNAPPHMLKALFQDRIAEDDKIAEAIAKNPRKYLFALESSYGADIYATCDEMRIEPTGQP